jgi:hypothetical protein
VQADPHAAAFAALERVEAFLQWLGATLLASLYPGAPFERKLFALETLVLLLETWGPDAAAATAATPAFSDVEPLSVTADSSRAGALGGDTDDARRAARLRLLRAFAPHDASLTSAGATNALLGNLLDSRDRLRAGEGAISCVGAPVECRQLCGAGGRMRGGTAFEALITHGCV